MLGRLGAYEVAGQNAKDNLEALLGEDVRWIVSACPTCTVALKHEFGATLRDLGEKDWEEKAAQVAAKAIVYASEHPGRREYWVGASTAGTLLANAVAPGILDRYLARTGFQAQQTDQPHDPHDPGNLWHPKDAGDGHDYGAHGEFDAKAKDSSVQVWASQHHGLLAAAFTLAAVGAAVGLRRR